MQQLDPKLELPQPPRPLIESNPVAQPYPVQALGGILGPAVERMAEVIGVPQALAAQSVLAASALATQGHAGLQLDGRNYPLSLYLITVAASGDRKTAADRSALLKARHWQREQWQHYRKQPTLFHAFGRDSPYAFVDVCPSGCSRFGSVQLPFEPAACDALNIGVRDLQHQLGEFFGGKRSHILFLGLLEDCPNPAEWVGEDQAGIYAVGHDLV